MKKISKMVLHNFKSHKHTEVPFNDFTAIIGPTNSGKSAIIGGIKWCLYNEPSGKRFISHGEKLCYVEVYFDDSSMIRRTRGTDENGSEVNLYELQDTDGNITTLSNFGVGPVDVVTDFHGMPKVNLFDNEESLTICDQFEKPFFLSESPQKRAKMIGRLAKTDVIDLALQNTNLKIRHAKTKSREYKNELKIIEKELKTMKDLPKMEKDLEVLTSNSEVINNKLDELTRINFIKDEIVNLEDRKDKLENIIKSEEEVNNLIKSADNITHTFNKLNRVMSVNENLINAINQKNDIEDILNVVDMDKLASISKAMDDLLNTLGEVVKIKAVKDKLDHANDVKSKTEITIEYADDVEKVLENIDYCKSKIDKLNKVLLVESKLNHEIKRSQEGEVIINQLENQYESRLNKYKDALIQSKKCPLCMSDIDEEKIKDIGVII